MKCLDAECHDKVVKLNFFMKLVGAVCILLIGGLISVCLYAMESDKTEKSRITELEKQHKVYGTKQDTIIFNQSLFRQDIKEMKNESKEYRDGLQKKMTKDKEDIIKAIRNNN